MIGVEKTIVYVDIKRPPPFYLELEEISRHP
jgi:hypothetical protein